MSRFFVPLLLIALSVGSFLLYTKPIYDEALVIKEDTVKLEDAKIKLDEVVKKKEELINKYNALKQEDIARLEKLMPANLDNIRLIIDVDNTAKKYGLILNAVKFDVDQKASVTQKENLITGRITSVVDTAGSNQTAVQNNKDYNSFGISFTVTGTFDSLIKLLSDMENNLRIIDISKINFNVGDKSVYQYEIKSKIYWLKDAKFSL